MSDIYRATKPWHSCPYCMGLFRGWLRDCKDAPASFNQWAARIHMGYSAMAWNEFTWHRCDCHA